MRTLFVITTLCLACVAFADDALQTPIPPLDLVVFLDRAKQLAVLEIEGIQKTDLVGGFLAPYYASRTSAGPSGVLACFTIRASQKNGSEERVVVIFHEDANKRPEVKKLLVALNQGLPGIIR